MTRLEYHLLRSRPVQFLIHWLKGIVLPGFEGVSLFDSLNFFRKQIFSNRFTERANAVSFSFLMSLPPLLLFFFTLVPYLPLPEERILAVIQNMLDILSPGPAIEQKVSQILRDFFAHKKNVLLSFSVLLTLYYASNGMMGLMYSFEKQQPGFKQVNSIRQRIRALLLTLMLILGILCTISFMLLQTWVAHDLDLNFMQNLVVIRIFAYVLLAVICFLTVSFIYKFGTITEGRWKLFSPGSIIATLLIIGLTLLFFYAVNNLVNYNKIYGSIGTLIIFLVWMNFIAQILLIGFELNASIIVNRNPKKPN